MVKLLTVDRPLEAGTIVDRPNRFVVRVRFDDATARVFLGDPGELEGIVEPGQPILCAPADDPDRATDYDAIAARVDDVYVSLRASLANDLFETALEKGARPAFAGYTLGAREPPLPEHGRADFRLATPDGDRAIVEVKSCTFVQDGIAKFPDRQTERGRRHLRSLASLHEEGQETHLVFVVQRPDVEQLAPYRAVDPEFASLLAENAEQGVGIHTMVTAFEPPVYELRERSLPVVLD